MQRFWRGAVAATLVTFGAAMPALAHGGDALAAHDLWTAWRFSPEIVIATGLVLFVYLRGMVRRKAIRNPVPAWRHAAFLAGVALIFIALQSPIDPFAERAFWIHQIQHLLLRMAGPALLAISTPEGVLVAGLPRWARRSILRPLAQSRAMRGLSGFLGNALVVFVLFMASLIVWQVPSIHNAALLNPYLHYLMHVTMLLAGMLFFWRIFSRVGPPKGLRYGVRVLMLIGSSLLSIVLGSLTTLKEHVLYTAYDVHGRLFVESALSDEQSGGFIIWISGPMMALIPLLIIMFSWDRNETRRYQDRFARPMSNSQALEFPETAEELWIKVEKPNRDTRLGLFAIAFSMFVMVMGLAILAPNHGG